MSDKAHRYWYYNESKKYTCKYCGYKFDVTNSFICPRCLKTN